MHQSEGRLTDVDCVPKNAVVATRAAYEPGRDRSNVQAHTGRDRLCVGGEAHLQDVEHVDAELGERASVLRAGDTERKAARDDVNVRNLHEDVG